MKKQMISHWHFAAGSDKSCLAKAVPVTLPHTWSVDEQLQNHVGKGWYQTTLPEHTHERTFLHFHAAYRDTDVYVNGKHAGSHYGSGYTPFTFEITDMLPQSGDAELTVCVDNSFSEQAVPYGRSFDWSNDGGLYRPVELWQTGAVLIRETDIIAAPVILPNGKRQSEGQSMFGFSAVLDGMTDGLSLNWALYRGAENSITPMANEPLLQGTLPCNPLVQFESTLLPQITYWHFDMPELYTLCLCVTDADGNVSDELQRVIGFRELKLQGEQWLLNGEAVRLPGMEWMPGSNPAIGSAEKKEDLEKMLSLIRESNCILTRFHWQQDDWVFDWCDRHGLLVQEEIPFWGKQPEGDPETLWPVIQLQLKEMITAHRHHPSVFAWGMGNELSGHTWATQHYVRRAVAYAHRLDPARFANYVTNTAWRCPTQDAAGDGDLLMNNDYIGTWEPNREQDPSWRELLDAHPGRAFIPSEFGLCEPAFAGGDAGREKIFLEKTRYYRQIPQIVGTIYFCLNDYRTHMGEEGEGRLCRRVHGSAGLCGELKPSWYTVQREHAPLIAERTADGFILTCRSDLPCYAVTGYRLTDGSETIILPDMMPGERHHVSIQDAKGSRLLRPNGDPVLTLV